MLSVLQRGRCAVSVFGSWVIRQQRSTDLIKKFAATLPRVEFMADETNVVTTVDKIIQSPEDKRAYRGLKLPNGLKILLVSDSTTDKSAAALDVNVGHLLDPRELPGLAHFCEHMLFLGTEKYPIENAYQKFLASHGGGSNAYTSTDHTNYFFDVAPDQLEGALDRFAQFFVAPLFSQSCTEREVNAVNSEHNNYLQNDVWRVAQLERSLSDSRHDYSKFGTGSRKTLLEDAIAKGLDPRQELLKFHSAHYSANLMNLAVVGKESLDELTELVLPRFSIVQNRNFPPPEWKEHPYGNDQLGFKLEVVPVKDLRSLHISFPIPDLHCYYRSNPGHYIGHLLGHEGPGSLLSELKRRGWVNSLVGGPRTAAKGFGFFSLDVDLSEEGEDHVDDIVMLAFHYINMLRAEGPKEWIHREVEDLSKISFRFKDKESPQSFASSLATTMHFYPLEEVLYGPFMMPDYSPELINKVLDLLNPDNMNVALVSRRCASVADQKEPWYGTAYRRTALSKELLAKCRETEQTDGLQLPKPNEFIPSNFEVLCKHKAEKPSLPKLVFNDALCRLFYKLDDEYLLPKAYLFFRFHSPYVYLDPWHWNMAYMFVALLRDALTEYVYNAELSGLRYSLENTKYSMELSLHGYNEKQGILLQRLIEKMVTFKPDPKRFEILKEQYIRSMRNFKMDQPYQHAVYYTALLLSERTWSKEELLQASDDLTLERFEKFMPVFLSALHCEAYVHGNIPEDQSLELVRMVLRIIREASGLRPLFSSQLMRDREVILPSGKAFVYEAQNEVHPNSAVEMYLQCGEEQTSDNMLLELLTQIIQEPCFDQLRTKEQLGYLVWSGARRTNGIQGVRFIVQSEHSPVYLESRIEAFLVQMLETIREMPDEEFARHKAALATRRLEKPKRMSGLAHKYWSEISAQTYNFDRDNIEVGYLQKISKKDVLDYFERLIANNSGERKKLCVRVKSTQLDDQKDNLKTDDEAKAVLPEPTTIKDINKFKATLPLYPLPKPFMEIPEPTPMGGKCHL